ncbi:MAG TPA: hypothetical protein VK814_11935 [Acidobacteriaceae bacterium]|jgi:hypothetical protein|nr:hypothetical protein [Acidobacteriaceae bacterium]
MHWEITKDSNLLTLRLQGERRRSDIVHFIAVAICLVGMHFCFGERIERVIGLTLGLSWATFILVRQQFGTSTLSAGDDTITLDRRTLGIGRTRRFKRSDAERLGFEAANQQEDAALALMVRTVMMPMRFSHGITPDEATAVFAKVKESDSWLAGFIRPVGTPMF